MCWRQFSYMNESTRRKIRDYRGAHGRQMIKQCAQNVRAFYLVSICKHVESTAEIVLQDDDETTTTEYCPSCFRFPFPPAVGWKNKQIQFACCNVRPAAIEAYVGVRKAVQGSVALLISFKLCRHFLLKPFNVSALFDCGWWVGGAR